MSDKKLVDTRNQGSPLVRGSEPAETLYILARVTRRLPARQESPERAQPSLVGVWGNPPTLPLRFPPGKRPDLRRWGRAHSGAPLRNRMTRRMGVRNRHGGGWHPIPEVDA